MLNKMRNNPKTTRNVVIVAVLALLLLCGVGRASNLQADVLQLPDGAERRCRDGTDAEQ